MKQEAQPFRAERFTKYICMKNDDIDSHIEEMIARCEWMAHELNKLATELKYILDNKDKKAPDCYINIKEQ